MSKEKTVYRGIGFPGLLTIAFIVLKLTGFINWSWWWVTSPMWGGFTIVLLVSAIVFIISVFQYINKK